MGSKDGVHNRGGPEVVISKWTSRGSWSSELESVPKAEGTWEEYGVG
jgi:hypothetical protein